MKEIINIVIYNSYVDGKEIRKACIFYNDGDVKNVDYYDDGINAIKEVLKREHITKTEDFAKMMNNKFFYTMSEESLKENYNSFLPQDEEVLLYKVNYNGNSSYDDFTSNFDNEIEDEELAGEKIEYNEDNFINNAGAKIKEKLTENNYEGLKIVGGVVLGVALIAGVVYVSKRCSKQGTMISPTNTKVTTTNETEQVNVNASEYPNIDDYTYVLDSNDNSLYNDYTFAELLEVTNNEFQKNSMVNASSALVGFNSVFAKNYIESGHDIKAALSFDEVVALQQAYNNYSIDEVRAYFNGYEVNAVDMSNNYKSATAQLIGAYIIESKENPVDMTILIDSQEGRDFYNRYHDMYLAAKYAEGEEQLRLVKEFYDAVRKDFPITEEVRTEGISHREDHSKIKDYQLAVIPIIDAAERLFQNLEIDYTLGNESEDLSNYDFMNDLGLCNHVDDKYERLETITLTSYEDKTNPSYEQYRNAIIAELVNSNEYVIDDAHRELSNLRLFQQIINNDPLWKHRNGEYNGPSYSYYETTESYSWSDSETVERTETTQETKEIPSDKQKEVDDQIQTENDKARQEAEQAAEEERAREQAYEDQKANDIEKEIEEEEKQLQEDINNANKTIDNNNKDTDESNNKPVNENDFHGNVDFDDNHSNNNGDLDNSVENITTDGTAADIELPDPNVTGKDFDNKSTTTTYTTTIESTESVTTYTEQVGENAYIEYDQEYTKYDEDGNPVKAKVRQLVRKRVK